MMWKTIKINQKYSPLFKSDCDIILIEGGRGSGKSFTVADWACRTTYQKGENILYTRYTLTSAKDSIIPEYKEKIELYNSEPHFEISENNITNKLTNAKIFFRGIKQGSNLQTANLKSLHNITKWICDEANEIPNYDIFQRIRRSLRKKGVKLQIVLIFNSDLPTHWIYKHFYDPHNLPDLYNGVINNIAYIHTNYFDNLKNLSETFLQDAAETKERNFAEYEVVFLGKRGDFMQELLFPKEKLRLFNFLDLNIKQSEIVSFTDPADGGDYFATVFAAIYDKKAYIFDVIFNKNRLEQNLEMLASKIVKYKSLRNDIEINQGGTILPVTVENHTVSISGQKYEVAGTHEHTNKRTRIYNQSFYILDKCYFRNDYKEFSPEFELFMQNLFTYAANGKNANDDAPDVMAALSRYLFAQNEFD